jgi:type VII secretion protein EccE
LGKRERTSAARPVTYADAIDAVQICVRSLGADPARLAGSVLGQIAHDLAQSAPPIRLREVFVSVRIDPVRSRAAISARGGGIAGLGRLASAALSRVRAEAFSAGLLATPLDAVGALRAMSGGVLQPPSTDGQPVRWIESWKSIASAQVRHRSFVVTSWSDADLDALAAVPGYGLTISHEVQSRPGSQTYGALTVIRLSAFTAGQLDTATHELRQACRRLGVSVRLLRGRQAQALRLTLPGGPR